MLTKEKRIEQLLEQDDSHWRWGWGVAIATVVMTLVIATQSKLYAPLLVFISFFPYLCFEWRKTKLLLTFNEDARYQRLVYIDFGIQWLCFVLTICLLAAYYADSLSPVVAIAGLFGIGVMSILAPYVINRHLHSLDAHHVRGKELCKARDQRFHESKTNT